MKIDVTAAKTAARNLRTALSERGLDLGHSEALELVSHQLGFRDWNTASAMLGGAGDGPLIPVLRVQEVDLALDHYQRFLGFTVVWRHQFEPGTPWYVRIERGSLLLDLSEHYGDGTPGGVVWIAVADVTALLDELRSRGSSHARPSIDPESPGGPTLTITDPYGNVLRFCQPNSR